MASAAPVLSDENPQVELVIWGDSHLADNHFFPQEFRSLLALQPRFGQVTNNSKGGKRCDAAWVNQIKAFGIRNQNSPKHFVHIFCVGGNNIRDAFRGSNVSPHEQQARALSEVEVVFQRHLAIITELGQNSKNHCVVIPPPPSRYLDHEPFHERLSVKLQQLTSNPKVLFVKIRDSLSHSIGYDQEGFVRRVLNKDLFAPLPDEVHLNRAGAKILASRVAALLQQIPNADLGYIRLRKNRR